MRYLIFSGIFIGITLIFISINIFTYPESYISKIWEYKISDLGRVKTPNGSINLKGRFLFLLSLFAIGIALQFFSLGMFSQKKLTQILLNLTSITIIGVGIFPTDTNHKTHTFFADISFLIVAVAYITVLLDTDNKIKYVIIFGLVLCGILYYITKALKHIFPYRYDSILQKIIVAVIFFGFISIFLKRYS